MSKKYKYFAIALLAPVLGLVAAGCSTTNEEPAPTQVEETTVARVEHDTYDTIANQLQDAGVYDDVAFAEGYYQEMAEVVCEAREEGITHEDTLHMLNDMMAMKRSGEVLNTLADVLYANECPEYRI